MKKVVCIAVALLGIQLSVQAQETPTPPTPPSPPEAPMPVSKKNNDEISVYVGFGVNVLGNYELNKKLKASGMPEIASAAPELTVGLAVAPNDSAFLTDIEFSTAFMDDKTLEDRMKTTVIATRLRVQYKLFDTDKLYFSGGLDLGYQQTLANLYSKSNSIDLDVSISSKSNSIDLDDIDTSFPGLLSMRSGQLIAGPSVGLLLFRDKGFPLRINAGYNIGITNGKWKSDFAEVTNTVKEMGLGNFYARLSIGF